MPYFSCCQNTRNYMASFGAWIKWNLFSQFNITYSTIISQLLNNNFDQQKIHAALYFLLNYKNPNITMFPLQLSF